MTLVFYTSGHGFGHASRDVEVINAIARRRPEVRLVVRSNVARWFFEASLRALAGLQPVEADTGVVQIDSLTLDEDATIARAAAFYAAFDDRADAEARVLRDLEATVVVGDIPPLAFAAAHRAGVPAVALGNFTWDWIYEGYAGFRQRAHGVLDVIRAAYALAARALRLPIHGGFEPMRAVVEDIPLIARHSALGREAAREALRIGRDDVAVLPSFGAYGLGLDFAAIERDQPFRLIRPDRAPPALRYEDLVAAADVVVSKPGYGIVSECIANGAALLYTSRGRFREHDLFVAEMPAIMRCAYLAPEDLRAGRWGAAVQAVLAQPQPAARLRTDGASAAAAAILASALSLCVLCPLCVLW